MTNFTRIRKLMGNGTQCTACMLQANLPSQTSEGPRGRPRFTLQDVHDTLVSGFIHISCGVASSAAEAQHPKVMPLASSQEAYLPEKEEDLLSWIRDCILQPASLSSSRKRESYLAWLPEHMLKDLQV